MHQKIRRTLGLLSMIALIIPMLAACATPATPTASEPVTVKETVVVRETQVVMETVEVVVTPTPVPPPISGSGPVFIGTNGMTGKHYNPIWMTSNPQFLTFPLILPALTWFNDQVQPIPDLASKIDVNEDATEYTFHLPENATWSDGTPLTAKDVAFTYKLALSPSVGQSVWANNFSSIKGATAFSKGEAEDVEGIVIVDDQTIRFDLAAPNAAFLFNTYLGILPEHILGSVPLDELEQNAYIDAPTITSGPYDFVEYVPDQYIHLKKKADYWGKQVSIDEIFVKLFESNATMLAQLEAGEIHMATITADEVERMRTFDHLDVIPVKGIGYYVTHLDGRNQDQIDKLNVPKEQGGKGYSISKVIKPYMLDKSFRQALAYAIDQNAVIAVVAGGEATPIYSSIFAPDWAVNPDLNTYDRDVEKAKSLMTEAGITFADNGTALWEDKPITLVFLASTGEQARQMGEVLQQQLGEVGIRLDIKLVTSSAFIQAAINGEGDLILNAGGRFGADPSVSSLYYTCAAGWAELVIGYCNPDFDQLMADGVKTSNLEERGKIYKQASALLNDELPSLFFYTANSFLGVNKGLTGVKPSADPGYLTWNIEEWSFK